MKKLLSILIVLALTLSFCLAEAQDLTGEWYTSLFGVSVTLVVNEDGTCAMIMPGEEPSEGAWEVDGNQFIINKGLADETVATIGEGALTIEEDGFAMEFTREPVAAIELPAAVTAESITDFDGSYEASMLVIPAEGGNMTIDMGSALEQGLGALLGIDEDVSLVIENGSVSIFGEEAQAFTFTDGKLYLPSPDAETPDLEQTLELLEDGSVSYTLMGMQIVFAAVSANA